jgi:hypothetical protein
MTEKTFACRSVRIKSKFLLAEEELERLIAHCMTPEEIEYLVDEVRAELFNENGTLR